MLRNQLERITKSKFAKNVSYIAGGALIAQIFNLLLTPLITRIYGPELYGIYGTFNAILTFLIPLTSLNFSHAIIIAKSDEECDKLFLLSLYSVFFTSALSVILIILADLFGGKTLDLGSLNDVAIYLSIGMLFAGLHAIANQLAIRENKYLLYSKASVILILSRAFIIITVGFYYVSSIVLILGVVFSYLISSVFLVHNVSIRFQNYSARELFKTAVRFKDFALFRTPQLMINAFSQGMPILILSAFIGVREAGLYTLTKMVMTAPASLIGQSFATAFYPKINSLYVSGKSTSKCLLETNVFLLVVSIPPLLIIFWWGPQIFSTIFGKEWELSGEFARWLSIATAMSLITRPSVSAIAVFGVQKEYFYFELISVIVKLSTLIFVSVFFKNVELVIVSFSVISAILDAVLMFSIYRYSTTGSDT